MRRDALVVWTGEFGCTPHSEGVDGCDHNVCSVKPGHSHGASDGYGYGYEAGQDKVPIVDFHATMLHLLGLDHEQLTYPHAARDFRLTDTKGNVVTGICA